MNNPIVYQTKLRIINMILFHIIMKTFLLLSLCLNFSCIIAQQSVSNLIIDDLKVQENIWECTDVNLDTLDFFRSNLWIIYLQYRFLQRISQ